MALAKLVVLANLDIDCCPAPEPGVASLLVLPLPQVADLQTCGLRASGADERGCGSGQAVSPPVDERQANSAPAGHTTAGRVVGDPVGQEMLHSDHAFLFSSNFPLFPFNWALFFQP